jgi:hypothetical protein
VLSSPDVLRWRERAFRIMSSYGATRARGLTGPYDAPPSNTGSAHAASAASALARRRPCPFDKVCWTLTSPLMYAARITTSTTDICLLESSLGVASPGRRRIHHRRCRSYALLVTPRISHCSHRGMRWASAIIRAALSPNRWLHAAFSAPFSPKNDQNHLSLPKICWRPTFESRSIFIQKEVLRQ